ncbi:FAD binding domain-containing protein [Sciscionella marina]|uniref:FAD binding domain-containing protein n=1 Tax=Sciscionella marina TaxID=508770 RepID=UPI000363E91E|nr:FAD binding domain-containing protein [Sciscionella marina]
MIPAPFDYAAPSTVEEAVTVLADAGEDAKVLGGGQSLMPVLRMRLAAPTTVVDLGRIPELRGIREEADALVIGAMTTHDEVCRAESVRAHAALLAEATHTVADPQIRHRGTFGGSLAHADPAGDLLAPALALDASMTIAGPAGRRTVPAAEFFVDFFTTALAENEVLVEVRVPKHTGWQAHYEKFNRVAQAWSTVAVGAALRMEGGAIAEAKVGLTNMDTVPVRARTVEAALIGRPVTAEAIREAARDAAAGANPGTDANADAAYRTQLARVLTARAVTAAART